MTTNTTDDLALKRALPVTASLRRIARAHLGTLHGCGWLDLEGWWRTRAWPEPGPLPIVPLHTGAGLAIGLLRLAELTDLPITGGCYWFHVPLDPSYGTIRIGGFWRLMGDEARHVDFDEVAEHGARAIVPGISPVTDRGEALALALRALDPEMQAGGKQ